ncbi:MAG TPA: hypothetical protein VEY95_17850 [Azospirillaceae bacterium]|nr:hypothetical protein [Azospirillaceae bacterium]
MSEQTFVDWAKAQKGKSFAEVYADTFTLLEKSVPHTIAPADRDFFQSVAQFFMWMDTGGKPDLARPEDWAAARQLARGFIQRRDMKPEAIRILAGP